MLIALSFIGTGNYEAAAYQWRDRTFKTDFLCSWIRQEFKPERQFLLLTDGARERQEATLRALGYLPEQLITVPAGAVEHEMWHIFEIIGSLIQPNDRVILDVTHGFRSQPMLLLAATQYFRRTKQAAVVHTFYATFDAGMFRNNPDTVFDIVDLNPFFDITDWAQASDAFIRHGRPGQLAALCQRDEHLQCTAKILTFLETAISVSSMELMLKAFQQLQEHAKKELSALSPGHPLRPHLSSFNDLLSAFNKTTLSGRQLALARYTARSGNTGFASVALQEGIISLIMEESGLEARRIAKSEERLAFSGWLSARSASANAKARENQTHVPELVQAIPWCDASFFENYKQLQRIRLTAAHAKPDPEGHTFASAAKDITFINRMLSELPHKT